MKRTGFAALAATLAVLVWASTAQAAYQWYDGQIQKSRITNCVSIINGSPYQEDGAWNWAGFYVDQSNLPHVGDVFYTHVVVGGVGNACSGQYAHIEFTPSSGIQTAISSANPVICYAVNFNTNTETRDTADCPQTPQTGTYGPAFDPVGSSNPWPLPQGRGWEIQIPVVATREMHGIGASPCDCVAFSDWILDGNSAPWLHPNNGVYVLPAVSGGGGTGGGGGGSGSGTGTGSGSGTLGASGTNGTAPVAPSKKCKKKKGHRKCKKRH
jgi:hypothetical protein